MFKSLKKTAPKPAAQHKHACPDCGCDLRGGHWQRCPRCQRELDPGMGCQSCGCCNH